ncbi:MAG: dihydrofolate reductase family protein [Bacteroidota bacterium]
MIYAMSVSLDGFIETADGDIRWSAPDEELHRHFNNLEGTINLHLYGRRMYETMAAYWPTADKNTSAPKAETEYARIWKEMKKIVFSKTLKKVEWNSQLVSENIAEEVNRLKAQPGIIMSVSGAGIASTFMQLGLIDEYCLYVHPIILGSGKPMFAHLRDKINLTLIETRTFGSRVVLLKLANKGMA